MKKALFLLLLTVCTLTHAQKAPDRGDLIFRYVAPKNNTTVSYWLYQERGLETLRNHINDHLALPKNIPVNICNCGEQNAWYSPAIGELTLCYEMIDYLYELLKADFFKDKVSQQRPAVIGTSAFILLHELGHALRHQYNWPITGKEENAVDEFALISLVDYKAEPNTTLLFYGIVSWYYLGNDQSKGVAFGRNPRQFSDEHAPSYERYYDLLSRYVGSEASQPHRKLIVGNVNSLQLPPSRAERSPYEFKTAVNAWNTILSPYRQNFNGENSTKITQSKETVETSKKVEGVGLYGKLSGSTTGLALNVSGWGMGARPQVNDDSNESGRIVFDITVDYQGYIINTHIKESTVSQTIVDIYKNAVSKMKLVPKADAVPSTTKGTITFNIKSR